MIANGQVYVPFIGASFASFLILDKIGFCAAKLVTINNGIYTMLAVVIILLFIQILINWLLAEGGLLSRKL